MLRFGVRGQAIGGKAVGENKKLGSGVLSWLQVPRKRKRGVHSSRRSGWHMADTFWPSMGWRAWARYILLKLRRSAADPHRVALGMALGMWANFLPLPGMGSILAVGGAWLLRANMMAAFIGQLVGNAWTMPFIWWISFKVGRLVFPLDPTAVGFAQLMANFSTEYILENWRILAKSVMLPLAAGGQIIGLPLAILSYWLTHWEVKRFWKHRRTRKDDVLHADNVRTMERMAPKVHRHG